MPSAFVSTLAGSVRLRRNQPLTEAQRARLIADGWKFGNVQELLGLTDKEAADIEARVERDAR